MSKTNKNAMLAMQLSKSESFQRFFLLPIKAQKEKSVQTVMAPESTVEDIRFAQGQLNIIEAVERLIEQPLEQLKVQESKYERRNERSTDPRRSWERGGFKQTGTR